MLYDLGVYSYPVTTRTDYETLQRKHKQLRKQRAWTDRERRMLDFLNAYFEQFDARVAETTLYLRNVGILDARIAHVEKLIRKGNHSYRHELNELNEKKYALQEQAKKNQHKLWLKYGVGAALVTASVLALYKTGALSMMGKFASESLANGLTYMKSWFTFAPPPIAFGFPSMSTLGLNTEVPAPEGPAANTNTGGKRGSATNASQSKTHPILGPKTRSATNHINAVRAANQRENQAFLNAPLYTVQEHGDMTEVPDRLNAKQAAIGMQYVNSIIAPYCAKDPSRC